MVSAAMPELAPRKIRTCKCGYRKSDPHIVEEPEYSLWGWLVLSMAGITPKPSYVAYRCQICRQTLGTTRDPKVLAARTQRPPSSTAPAPPSPESEEKKP